MMAFPIDTNLWGPLASRYSQPKPRRMLTLDGGGIRGLLTLQVLLEIEQKLARHYYPDDEQQQQSFRLYQFFDYIGGTSTGAIIAAALALGMSVQEILEFYQSFGKVAFTKRRWIERWKSLYENGELQQKLKSVFGETTTLKPKYLKTLLLVVTRNATTDSAWPLSSNPAAKYNDPTRTDCNLKIPLWKLVRASTAAPVFFPPETLQWDPNDETKEFVFVDGGTTPYNNPAFLLTRMATEPAYKLGWQRGEQNLLVVSVGTGTTPSPGNTADDPESNLAASALSTLSSLMYQAQVAQDFNCRTVGRCTYGPELDREVGDLIIRDQDDQIIPFDQDQGRGFLYARYDLELTYKGLKSIGITDMDPQPLQSMDKTQAMPELARIGQKLGEKVDLAHFGGFVDLPLYL
jgi:uncharacterized protein